MILQLQDISKLYKVPGTSISRTILDHLSLNVEKGSMVGIVGPSGSGKSTLLNIAGTLDKPDHGKVFLGNEDVSGFNDAQLSHIRNQRIGFVFQMHHLLPQLSLMENVLLPIIPQRDKKTKDSAAERAKDLLGLVGLKDKVTQRPGQMSVGECQRAALVRALINQPEILLADEPTGSLDRKSAEQLGELLVEINAQKGISMIVVTHSGLLANSMQMIYTLTDGKLIPRSINL